MRGFASIVLLLSLIAGHTSSYGQTSATYRVSGIAVNDTNSEPLSSCTMRLFSRAGQEAGTASQTTSLEQEMLTDGQGYFHFDHVPRGRYRLIAEKRGFPVRAYEEHDGFSTAIVTGPNLDTANLIFRLIPNSLIFGFVLDEASEPSRNAQVHLYRARGQNDGNREWQRVAMTSTDDRGRFEFAGLNPGTYYVSVSARPWYADHTTMNSEDSHDAPANPELDVTYGTIYYPGATDPVAAEPILLKGGEQIEADITLSPIPALHLKIQLGSRERGQQFSYSIQQKMPDGTTSYVPFSALRGTSGAMEFTGLAPGKYELQLFHYTPGSRAPNAAEMKREIDLTGNVTINEKTASSTENSTITAKILMPAGSNAQSNPFLEFQPIQRSTNATKQSQTASRQSDGTYQISLPAGQYRIAARNAGPFFIGQMAADGAKISGKTITIPATQTSVHLVVEMIKGLASLDGFAQKGDKPASGVVVALIPENPQESTELLRRDQSNSDGSFNLERILPGRYYLLALERGWEIDWTNVDMVRPYLTRGILVELKPGDSLKKNVQVQHR